MSYKNIFLIILLVPFTAMGSDDNALYLQKLKSDHFERMLKLSEMSDVIIQKQNLIDDMTQKTRVLFARASQSLNDEQKEQLKNEILNFGVRLDKALSEKNIKGFISYEFFDDEKNNDEFVIIKSLIFKKIIEKAILKELVEKYEEYMQETIAIEVEIENYNIKC